MLRPQHLIYLVVVTAVFLALTRKPAPPPVDDSICAGPPLRSAEEREQAMEAGYSIHPGLGCIEKRSFDAVNAERARWEQQHAQTVTRERQQLAQTGATALTQARHGFQTAIAQAGTGQVQLPQPPAEWFVRSDYKNPQNYTLPGFISPDPGDGRRHPAIIWLTGGDSNSLDDFWSPGPDSNDQSARAFREAGLIMVFPTLRGGNGGRSPREWLLGEVDDVLAAADQLKQIRYIDPDRIYLGGHSTGGTLALLTAEMHTPFKAVFAFGPVSSAEHYTPTLIPVDFSTLDPLELKLRSPIHWLDDIAQPTYVIEGMDGSGNGDELTALCAASRNPNLHCLPVRGADHYSVLRPATRAIAAQLAAGGALALTPEALAP